LSHVDLAFTEPEFKARLAAVRKAMDEAEEEALRARGAAEKLFEEGARGEIAEGAEEIAEDEAEPTE